MDAVAVVAILSIVKSSTNSNFDFRIKLRLRKEETDAESMTMKNTTSEVNRPLFDFDRR
jgi:hypothetical protein